MCFMGSGDWWGMIVEQVGMCVCALTRRGLWHMRSEGVYIGDLEVLYFTLYHSFDNYNK